MIRWLFIVLLNYCSRAVYFWPRINSAPQWMILCSQFIPVIKFTQWCQERRVSQLRWCDIGGTTWRCGVARSPWRSVVTGHPVTMVHSWSWDIISCSAGTGSYYVHAARCVSRAAQVGLGWEAGSLPTAVRNYYRGNRRYKGKWRNDRTDREITRLCDKHLWLMAVMLHKANHNA